MLEYHSLTLREQQLVEAEKRCIQITNQIYREGFGGKVNFLTIEPGLILGTLILTRELAAGARKIRDTLREITGRNFEHNVYDILATKRKHGA